MPSRYVFQVAEKNSGKVVSSWPPGEEADLTTEIVKRVQAKGVGFFTNEDTVLNAVRNVIDQAVLDVKAKVRP